MVLVIDPVTFIVGAIHVEVGTLPITLVLFPVPNVDIAITVHYAPETLLVILHEVPIIPGSIWPNLRAFAVTHGASPFASVLDFGLMGDLFSLFNYQVGFANQLFTILVVPLKVREVFKFFFHDRVFII